MCRITCCIPLQPSHCIATQHRKINRTLQNALAEKAACGLRGDTGGLHLKPQAPPFAPRPQLRFRSYAKSIAPSQLQSPKNLRGGLRCATRALHLKYKSCTHSLDFKPFLLWRFQPPFRITFCDKRSCCRQFEEIFDFLFVRCCASAIAPKRSGEFTKPCRLFPSYFYPFLFFINDEITLTMSY